ncbi:MAG: CBS domain-containing protein [bacterium]
MADVMTRFAVTVRPEADLLEAAHIFVDLRFGVVPVVDEAGASGHALGHGCPARLPRRGPPRLRRHGRCTRSPLSALWHGDLLPCRNRSMS